MRTVRGPSDHVVIVGAGLGGLSCAMRLAATGRDVTVIEREPAPGGRAGRLDLGGYSFDTGPTVLTMPELLADAFAAVDEDMSDWLTLIRLDPAYRAHFPDGSTLDVIADTARMAAEVSRVCGPREADGYLRFAAYASRLWQLQRDDFIDHNFDGPRDLITANLLRLAAAGGFRHLDTKIAQFFRDPRTRRLFSFQSMYAGLAPHQALALYSVIAYLDSIAGVYFPLGGIHSVPVALASAADKHGVIFRYDTTVTGVEVSGGRARAVHTADGDRIAADVVVLNPDLPVAYREVLAHGRAGSDGIRPPPRLARLRQSPSAVVLHVGSTQRYSKIAHHNIHFGRAWRETFNDVIRRGRRMRDPSLLVTNPSRTDPSLAPSGHEIYYVLAPTPNLDVGTVDWSYREARRYGAEIVATLEARGYYDFGAGIEVSHMVTPEDWAATGLAAGTPFASAHTLRQTGPFRPGNLHPALDNVVFVGSGTQPGVGVPMVLISGKLAAARISG